MALREWARRKNRELHRKAMEDRDSGIWHSRAYHDYFEGYTERVAKTKKGRTKIERRYTGNWYVQALEKREAILLRVVYVALFLLAVFCIVLAGIMQGSAGQAFYAVIPELVTLCLLARLFYVLFVNYLFAPHRMTVGEFRSSSPALKRTALYSAAAFGADLLMAVVDYALHRRDGTARFQSFPMTLLAFALGAVMVLLMAKIELHVPYEETKNNEYQHMPDDEGVTIDRDVGEGLFRRSGRT